jgi:magnesium chelatase family protein
MAIFLLFIGLSLHKIRGYIIFDRIYLHVEVPVVPFRDLSKMAPGEPSAVIRERVIRARNIQTERFRSSPQSGGTEGGYPLQRADDRAYAP